MGVAGVVGGVVSGIGWLPCRWVVGAHHDGGQSVCGLSTPDRSSRGVYQLGMRWLVRCCWLLRCAPRRPPAIWLQAFCPRDLVCVGPRLDAALIWSVVQPMALAMVTGVRCPTCHVWSGMTGRPQSMHGAGSVAAMRGRWVRVVSFHSLVRWCALMAPR